ESARMLSHEALRKLNLPLGWYEVFEAMGTGDIHLYEAHNEIHFYTWADFECCLPRGATSATLTDEYDSPQESGLKDYAQQTTKQQKPTHDHETPRKRKLNLKEDDVLIFEEVVSPTTGEKADADIAHRHAVRLTKVTLGEDKLTG